MPAQKRLGLDDEQGMFPGLNLYWLLGTSVRKIGDLVFHSHLIFFVIWYSTMEGVGNFSHALVLHS